MANCTPIFSSGPPDSPTLRFRTLLPHKFCQIIGYEVLPLPVNHKVPTVGYQVKDRQGKSLFYTGRYLQGTIPVLVDGLSAATHY